ncbi:CcdB family protein [Verminephrobacter aporrectodeae]|uniref:Toxin CcdB n=1 Tax=Verminephrobacter aporrectodeae subsp. tuberculatae TaxID=1110392 RepID=A0ABT3KQP5_9BURK|nr:CcdB family protein [Verminephrobacter aporrectodeae]MCW5220426.1 plasmid maintenance protein CcdB [Verminephrobacter aporrectodeae subsp. tuberculatae]MCW5255619.1 plasmid maintenance protein CcdB [Verminephrobacter aporrectodeae subsp. tuberculatae]MCW5289722.1 plasmid maintenance protein CcdB [Verminephrobacter aporrectodeae subsp. tuberculatae]MCW5320641.1 plasmid maintenance protein CcdB [Verminephrobacter aporrectodeae subsp. tuberculatae]MCW8165972.1 plasmid maintenance protein CcdB 
MARFDVYVNTGALASTTPYLLDVQSNLLDGLESCVVIPLRSLDHYAKVKLPTRLTPVFPILGRDCLLETPKMAAVPRRILRDCVASLSQEQARITAALDFLFQGY